MSSSLPLRRLRHICQLRQLRQLSSTTTATTASSISISTAKSKLRSVHDPDKALEIYNSVSKDYSSPVFSRYAQDITVRRLAKSHRFADIETLIESQKKDPKIKQEPFVCTLIRSFGQARMFDQALKTYKQMDAFGTPRSAVSFNALLTACNQSKLFVRVPSLFEEIPSKYGVSPNKISYGILIRSYCMTGNLEKAMEVLREMEVKGIEITTITFTTVLDALYKNGDYEQAEKLWKEMVKKGCELDVAVFNVRLQFAEKVEDVKALLNEMNDALLKPDTISYNYLMTCYLRNGMLEEAEKVYEELEGNGCKPNAATIRTMVYYLCKFKAFEKGYKVFKEGVMWKKIPDFGTLSLLVDGLVEKKKIREAKGLIRTAKKNFPPNLLNGWRKLEEKYNLSSPKDASTPALDEEEDEDQEAAK